MDKIKIPSTSIFGADNIKKYTPLVDEYLDNRINDFYKHLDKFVYIPLIDLFKSNQSNFIKIFDRYFFHIPTGFILHISNPESLKTVKFKQLAILPIFRGSIVKPGRFLCFAKRMLEGPKKGKYKFIGTLTHISCNTKNLKNKYTISSIIKARNISKKNNYIYPNYYGVMKKYRSKPIKDIVNLIYDTPFF